MAELLWLLFDACLQYGYHPQAFCNSTTVTLWKLGKADYRDPKVWHPITLLNMLGKALEVVVVGRIRYVAEKYCLLPTTQHGCCRQRNTLTALELLTEQIHTVWN